MIPSDVERGGPDHRRAVGQQHPLECSERLGVRVLARTASRKADRTEAYVAMAGVIHARRRRRVQAVEVLVVERIAPPGGLRNVPPVHVLRSNAHRLIVRFQTFAVFAASWKPRQLSNCMHLPYPTYGPFGGLGHVPRYTREEMSSFQPTTGAPSSISG